MNQKLADFMQKYQNCGLAVAVSGGADSMALLHMLVAIGLKPAVLHVNHKLRASADMEEKYIVDLCKKLDLPCKTFDWSDEKPESNLESAARDARYKMMTDWCNENGIKILMTAHHADDQIETFLMNLARGSGVYGLAAMRAESDRGGVKIVRPLLKVFRSELEKYCADNNIEYFTDEMNSDEKYTRVRIRKNRHLLTDILGISDDRILLAIENLGRTRAALDVQITNHESRITIENGRAVFNDSFLFDEPLDIRLKLLGRLVQNIGGNDYQPRLNSLERALSMLGANSKFTLGGCTLRRYGDKILIVPQGESVSFIRKENGRQKPKTNKKER